MTSKLVSIVIPTLNSGKNIESCIASLISQNFSREKYEIIVVDGGSIDDTVKKAKIAGADLVIKVVVGTHTGQSRNIGVENSKGNLIAFIDSDCVAKEGWINSIVEELKSVPVVTGPVLNGNPHSNVAWAEYFVEFGGLDEFKKRSIVRMFPGCNGGCTKEAFEKAGGYYNFHHAEDVLFGEKLKNAGFQVVFSPNVKIQHMCRTDINKVTTNLKKIGAYFIITRTIDPDLPYASLLKRRLFIPIIFFGKIGISAKYAIQAKKFGRFIRAFPFVVIASNSICKGISKQLSKNPIYPIHDLKIKTPGKITD